jgi:hypothetical protein
LYTCTQTTHSWIPPLVYPSHDERTPHRSPSVCALADTPIPAMGLPPAPQGWSPPSCFPSSLPSSLPLLALRIAPATTAAATAELSGPARAQSQCSLPALPAHSGQVRTGGQAALKSAHSCSVPHHSTTRAHLEESQLSGLVATTHTEFVSLP